MIPGIWKLYFFVHGNCGEKKEKALKNAFSSRVYIIKFFERKSIENANRKSVKNKALHRGVEVIWKLFSVYAGFISETILPDYSEICKKYLAENFTVERGILQMGSREQALSVSKILEGRFPGFLLRPKRMVFVKNHREGLRMVLNWAGGNGTI